MSKQIFEVTNRLDNSKQSINAASVAMIIDKGDLGADICMNFGAAIEVKESYRSVRGYVKKGLAPVADKEAETAE